MTSGSETLDTRPLADRLRPQSIEDVVGQEHLLDPGKPLRRMLDGQHLHSMILWVKDIRAAVEQAQMVRQQS